jgi:hypothetical protein
LKTIPAGQPLHDALAGLSVVGTGVVIALLASGLVNGGVCRRLHAGDPLG